MADPLSIAASIVGVATAALTVTKGLYRIADGIGSSGVEVRAYGDEIGAFSKVLCQLRAQVIGQTTASPELQTLLDDVVQLCDRTLSPVKAMMQILNPLLERINGNSGKLSHFGLRLQWIFSYKQKLLFYRNALSAQHRLLQTLLELIILQTTKDRSPENLCLLHMSLQQSTEVTATTVYGPRDRQASLGANYPQRQREVIWQPKAIEDKPQDLMEGMADTSGQRTAAGANLPLEDGPSDSDPTNTLVKSINGAVTEVNELLNLEGRIDHCLDPDNQASLVRIVRDIGITVPRALQLALQELRQNGMGSKFDQHWEDRVLSSKPLDYCKPWRYTKTIALLLHWVADDLFVLPEIKDLERCMREDYMMETETFPIPSHNAHLELMMKIGSFIKEHSSGDTLIILYYAGYGRMNGARQSIWQATRQADSPWLNFSATQILLNRIKSDVLILLDCASGTASSDFHSGNNLVETICASSLEDEPPADPGRYSFTNCLIEVLQEWRLKVFSAAMLHSELLNRLKHPRPITVNGALFEARATPLHFMRTLNSGTPSIEICCNGRKKVKDLISTTDGVQYQKG